MSEQLETALTAEEEQLNTQPPQDGDACKAPDSADAQQPEASEQPEENGKPKKGGYVDKLLWVVLGILGVLLIISIVVLSIRLVDYSKVDDRAVSLSTNMDETLDVFALEYENDSGDIVIKGSDGDKVLAPGASVEYTVRIRNTDKMAIDFSLTPQVNFLSDVELPIVVRLLDYNNEYIVGSATEWAPMEQMSEVQRKEILLPGQTVEYYFQWKWPYDADNDEYDTWLGNTTLDSEVGADLSFAIHATANTDVELNGGAFGYQTPDVIYIIIFMVLLVAAIVVLIIAVVRYFRKKLAPAPVDPEPEAEILPEPEPEVEAEPVPEPVEEDDKIDPAILAMGLSASRNIIRIDVLDANFEDGAFINLDVLKRKGLMHPEATTLKILSKGHYVLEKAFTVETHRISDEARRVILRAGGDVRIIKD